MKKSARVDASPTTRTRSGRMPKPIFGTTGCRTTVTRSSVPDTGKARFRGIRLLESQRKGCPIDCGRRRYARLRKGETMRDRLVLAGLATCIFALLPGSAAAVLGRQADTTPSLTAAGTPPHIFGPRVATLKHSN